MPELPDLTVYCEALERRVVGAPLEQIELRNPFLLRTAVPPIAEADGKAVRAVRRLGKRIVLALDGELFLALHLMIAGRLRWVGPQGDGPPRITLALFAFPSGKVVFTEAGTKRRASLHLIAGEAALAALDPGGVEPLACTLAQFAASLWRENHTLKRALTDPHRIAGIGNAYSDEILHRARLSPFLQTAKLDAIRLARLYEATRAVLGEWTARLRREAGDAFPEQVTAFRPEMAVHGKFGRPCPVCAAPVQRIVYAENECNYCANCQTGGVILADRALSRLLHDSFPRSLESPE